MILSRSFQKHSDMTTFLRGSETDRGATMSTTASSAAVVETGDAFANVSVGDTFYVSGEGMFTVVTKTDSNNITLDDVLQNTDTNVVWRSVTRPINPDDIIDISALNGVWWLTYDSLTFFNPA